MYKLTWIEELVQTRLPIQQVYGFIFDSSCRILVLDDELRYDLPDGKPQYDESLLETLIREVLEESQLNRQQRRISSRKSNRVVHIQF